MGEIAPVFSKEFSFDHEKFSHIKKAVLSITALGIYEAKINGMRVSDYVLAPGWTTYKKRLQYQQYDVTELLEETNQLLVTVGKGWYRSNLNGSMLEEQKASPSGLLAQLEIVYTDGHAEIIHTDESWKVSESEIRFSEIYDGENPSEGKGCFAQAWSVGEILRVYEAIQTIEEETKA